MQILKSNNVTNLFKRNLVEKFGVQQILDVDRFGRYRFYCENRIEIYRAQEYGGETISLAAFLFMLNKDDIVWDIGASIGLHTVHCAASVKQVVAFEPDPSTNQRLRQNIQLNGLSERVRVENCALSDKEGLLELHTDGLSGFAPSLKAQGRHSSVTKVPVQTIDQMVAAGVPCPTVIKMDIEGAEFGALLGGRSLMGSRTAPRLLFIEIHPDFLKSYSVLPDDIFGLVRSAGYKIIFLRQEHGQQHMVAMRI
jgi:FkbM family methyltransferase